MKSPQESREAGLKNGVLDSLYEALASAGGSVEGVPPEAMLATISKWEAIRCGEGVSGLQLGGGPKAHEDLNVSELIDSMLVEDEHLPGKLALRGPSGCVCWLPAERVKRFREEHGHEHPSNYAAKHGVKWEEELFKAE